MTRQPMPLDDMPSEIETTPPPVASEPLREPSEEFRRRVCATIAKSGSVSDASELWGVPRKRFAKWMRTRDGGPCDALRKDVRAALAYFKTDKAIKAADQNPTSALRRLDAREKQAEEGRRYSSAPRPYSTGSGHTLVQRATPFLLARIADENVPVTDLAPIEVLAREMRQQIIADCDGIKAITTTKRHLIDSYIGIWIAASSLDVYIAEMGAREGLVSRKHRRAFPIIEQRARLADSLLRLAQAIGLDKAKPGATALQQYVAANYPGTPATEPEITTEQEEAR